MFLDNHGNTDTFLSCSPCDISTGRQICHINNYWLLHWLAEIQSLAFIIMRYTTDAQIRQWSIIGASLRYTITDLPMQCHQCRGQCKVTELCKIFVWWGTDEKTAIIWHFKQAQWFTWHGYFDDPRLESQHLGTDILTLGHQICMLHSKSASYIHERSTLPQTATCKCKKFLILCLTYFPCLSQVMPISQRLPEANRWKL